MRRGLVAGNWKMNGRAADARALVFRIREALSTGLGIQVVLCPPFVYLSETAKHLGGTDISLGAQDLCEQSDGAITGEVSAEMLADVGCTFVIVGHSERRRLFGETDRDVGRKLAAAMEASLKPVLCIGETRRERRDGHTRRVLSSQLSGALKGVPKSANGSLAVAYEPVWAIGGGGNAAPAQVGEAHSWVRQALARRFGKAQAREVPILYGGSVNPDNARELAAVPEIDGVLVGGASLDARSFAAIVNAFSSAAETTEP